MSVHLPRPAGRLTRPATPAHPLCGFFCCACPFLLWILQAAELAPEDPIIWHNLGLTLHQYGDVQAAILVGVILLGWCR